MCWTLQLGVLRSTTSSSPPTASGRKSTLGLNEVVTDGVESSADSERKVAREPALAAAAPPGLAAIAPRHLRIRFELRALAGLYLASFDFCEAFKPTFLARLGLAVKINPLYP